MSCYDEPSPSRRFPSRSSSSPHHFLWFLLVSSLLSPGRSDWPRLSRIPAYKYSPGQCLRISLVQAPSGPVIRFRARDRSIVFWLKSCANCSLAHRWHEKCIRPKLIGRYPVVEPRAFERHRRRSREFRRGQMMLLQTPPPFLSIQTARHKFYVTGPAKSAHEHRRTAAVAFWLRVKIESSMPL